MLMRRWSDDEFFEIAQETKSPACMRYLSVQREGCAIDQECPTQIRCMRLHLGARIRFQTFGSHREPQSHIVDKRQRGTKAHSDKKDMLICYDQSLAMRTSQHIHGNQKKPPGPPCLCRAVFEPPATSPEHLPLCECRKHLPANALSAPPELQNGILPPPSPFRRT